MSKPGTNGCALEPQLLEGGIAVLTLDHFPVNSLSGKVTNGITVAVLELEKRIKAGEVKGVVLRGAGRCFCAGADISQFGVAGEERVSLGRPSSDSFGLEELDVPVVAAIHGFALGGGLELALGCHYRVIAASATIGLPEVNIGLLPGAQGTQRVPRLIGAENGLKLITSGDQVAAAQAVAWGVADLVAPEGKDLLVAAAEFCKAKAGGTLQRLSQLPPATPTDFGKWAKAMAAKRPGEPAPLAIIKCVEAASKPGPFADGVKAEAKLFGPLVTSPESTALRYMFFSERAGAKVDGLKAKPVPIKSVGIIGAGLMGGGIAMCCINVGIAVTILDVDQKNLERGMALITSNFKRSVDRGSRTQASVDKALALLKATTSYAELAPCDLVVEAVFEEMGIKKKIFAELDKVCKPGAFICSNTSALDIDEVASATSRPEFVMGTHFFSPANVMLMLENVRGSKTSDVTVASMMEWGKIIGKWPILVGNCPGFVGNRLIFQYSASGAAALASGAKPHEVDAAIEALGMKMGPFRMADMVGLDLGIQAKKKAGTFRPATDVKDAIVDAGRLGQKNGKGFYDYADGRTPTPSAEVNALVEKMALAKRSFTQEELQLRLFSPLVNEGFKVLEEGFCQRPADIDVCYVHGYGFPRYRGGPMHWADAVGLEKIKAQLEEMKMSPSKLLEECVAQKTTLAKHWPKYLKAKSKL